MGVGHERHVIVAIPYDFAQLPGAGEAAQLRCSFKERNVLAGLGETVGEGHAQYSTADDCQPFFVATLDHLCVAALS